MSVKHLRCLSEESPQAGYRVWYLYPCAAGTAAASIYLTCMVGEHVDGLNTRFSLTLQGNIHVKLTLLHLSLVSISVRVVEISQVNFTPLSTDFPPELIHCRRKGNGIM